MSDADHRTHDALLQLLPEDESPDWGAVVARAERRTDGRHRARRTGGVAGALAAVAAAAVGLFLLLPGGDTDRSGAADLTDTMSFVTTPFPVLRPDGEVRAPTFRIAEHRGAPVVMVVVANDCATCMRIVTSPAVRSAMTRSGVVPVYALLAKDGGASLVVGGDWLERAALIRIDSASLRSLGVPAAAPAVVVFDGQGQLADVLDDTASEDTLLTHLQGPARTWVTSYPDTGNGRRRALAFLRGLSRAPGQEGADYKPTPATLRMVFSQTTASGEYTVWHAQNGRKGETTLFSSPLTGVSARSGPTTPLPSGSYVRMEDGGALLAPPFAVREMWGRSSPDIRRLNVRLANGRRVQVIPKGGWWSFTQPVRDPVPVSVVGFDANGRATARTTGRLF